MTDLVLYKDSSLENKFVIENIGDTDAGSIRIIEGYLANNTSFEIVRIAWEAFDEDIKVIGAPESLTARAFEPVTIKYSPDKLRTKPLDSFITFHGRKRIPPE